MGQPAFSLSSDTYSNELEITSISGTESISKFFELKIDFKVAISAAATLDHESLTQDDITIFVEDITGRDDYSIKGIFSQIEEVFEKSNTHKYYTATMVPALWRQRNNQSYDIFTQKTVSDILSDELSNDLMLDHHLSLTQTYPVKEFICQYSESNFDFVCRMAEHWGIYYYFDHDQDGKLIFADDTNYEPLPIGTIKLDESNNPSNSFNSIRTLKRQFNAVPGSVVISETNPDQALELYQGIAGDVEDGKSSVNMADEGADNKDEADLLAKIRLEELQTRAVVFSGTTGLPCITPGFVLTVATPSGEEYEILILSMTHNGNNLDNASRAQNSGSQPFYECSFTGIPRATQFRPKRDIQPPSVISTTARVYSAADDQTLAQRNEVGKYQVAFDFMNGEEDKISSWIRHASHAGRSNHLDMPLTPGTEVQIGFIGGNPNRPYILNALENSQSVIHPVTHENPHHASIITDGMYYTGALKSRQSLHMTAVLDPTEVKEHINNHPLKHLDKMGIDSGNPVDTIKGDVHIDRTFGDRYLWREGVDFRYGLNATYNFGQQYIENHAYQDTTDGEDFDVSSKLDSFDDSVAAIVRSDIQPGLNKEREVGFVKKDFGNKYNYHEGYEYNWSAGTNGNGIQKTFNFGSAYIENHTADNIPNLDDNPTSGFPSCPDTSTDLITKTFGNSFGLQEGNNTEVLTGNLTSEMTGDTDETITGDITSTLTGDTNGTITGNITNSVTGDTSETITGNTDITKMGDDTVMHTGNQTITTIGDIINNHTGSVVNSDINTTYSNSGTYTSTFAGAYFETKLALATEVYVGGKIETFSGIIISNDAGELRKTQMNIEDVKTILQKKAKLIMEKASLMILG